MKKDDVDVFNDDIEKFGGYVYATEARLSCRLANERSNSAISEIYDFRGKSVIDIGCGDGAYTVDLFSRCHPSSILGTDLADVAVSRAKEIAAPLGKAISFDVVGAYALPYPDNYFDVSRIRAVLHHLDDPAAAVKEALRVATDIVIMDPNGYSPALKLLERISPYHRDHNERSHRGHDIDRWIQAAGARVISRKWVGMVPMFAPDWFAKTMKVVEPLFEATNAISRISCAVYVVSATKDRSLLP